MTEEVKDEIMEELMEIVNCDVEQSEACEGSDSTIGTFESSERLFEAYNELRAEFTRKCQELAELKKPVVESVSKKLDVPPAVIGAGGTPPCSGDRIYRTLSEARRAAQKLFETKF